MCFLGTLYQGDFKFPEDFFFRFNFKANFRNGIICQCPHVTWQNNEIANALFMFQFSRYNKSSWLCKRIFTLKGSYELINFLMFVYLEKKKNPLTYSAFQIIHLK